ncbi:MAG TPA: hypothetical protein ENI92_08090, partial [Bacteroidetes bacterium]|nr:hypothetical protein [Bacteroidota bacterium]
LAAGPVRYRAGTLRALARGNAARAALDTLAAPPAENPRIGVIVQQESEEDTTARDLLVGARAAVKVDEQAGGRGELVVRTVPYGAPEAVFAARTLVRREGVWALVISGHESDAIAAAVEAQAAGVPVVLPGRRRPDLYLAGPTVFMPEADWEREGAIAAMYAADSLHLRTFAVVAPATDLGRYLVEGFTKTLEARDSCEVLAVEWYFPEEGVSVSRQFLRIREIGFRRAFLDSLSADSVWHDSLWVADTTGGRDTTLLDSALWKRLWRTHLDSIRRTPAFKVGAIDSNAIELKTIEGLYFPIEPGTIELFAPQFAFYNFRAVKMGNAGWYDPEELYHQRQYTEDLVFTAPYRLEETEGVMAELATEVYRETGGAVHPWNIRGFDGVRMLLTAAACCSPPPWISMRARARDAPRGGAGEPAPRPAARALAGAHRVPPDQLFRPSRSRPVPARHPQRECRLRGGGAPRHAARGARLFPGRPGDGAARFLRRRGGAPGRLDAPARDGAHRDHRPGVQGSARVAVPGPAHRRGRIAVDDRAAGRRGAGSRG